MGSLPWGVDDQKLGEIFSAAGTVVSATVIKDKDTGRSKGYGFVEMSTEEEAQKAVQTLNGSDVDGRPIVVNIAGPREER